MWQGLLGRTRAAMGRFVVAVPRTLSVRRSRPARLNLRESGCATVILRGHGLSPSIFGYSASCRVALGTSILLCVGRMSPYYPSSACLFYYPVWLQATKEALAAVTLCVVGPSLLRETC